MPPTHKHRVRTGLPDSRGGMKTDAEGLHVIPPEMVELSSPSVVITVLLDNVPLSSGLI